MSGIDLAIKRLKDQVPLASLIRENVELKSRSGKLLGLCPFHNEKSPSFYVYDNNYYCYGCHAKGDCIEYVKQTQGLGFVPTLKYLSEKYSIALPELENSQKRLDDRNTLDPLYRCFQLAQEMFVKNLWSPSGQSALQYLKDRGFSEDNIKAFGFGLSLDSYSQLHDYIKKAGVHPENAIKVHLLRASQRSDRSDPYDFFRNRLMIPIRDQFGRIVGMGGRTLSKDDPVKYVNSQNHVLYDKKSVLFGYDHARKIIKQKNRAIIVEGYMDALQLWQHGFNESAAVLGTSLSLSHLHQISNSTQNVFLVFDGDAAGQAASLRTVDLILQVANLNAKIVHLPNNEDPDSFLRNQGPEAFEKQLENAQDLLEFTIRHEIKQSGSMSLPETINKKFIPWLAQVEDPIKRGFLLHKVSEQTGVSRAELEAQLRSPHKPTPKAIVDPESVAAQSEMRVTPPSRTQFEILGHLYFSQPGELPVERMRSLLTDRFVLDPFWMRFANDLMHCLEKNTSPSIFENPPWMNGGVAEIFELIDTFKDQTGAFTTTSSANRLQLIESLATDQTMKKIKGEILHYKQQITMLAKQSPDEQSEIMSILKKIDQLNDSLNAFRKLPDRPANP